MAAPKEIGRKQNGMGSADLHVDVWRQLLRFPPTRLVIFVIYISAFSIFISSAEERRHTPWMYKLNITNIYFFSFRKFLILRTFIYFYAKIYDYEDIKVQIAERFCKETSVTIVVFFQGFLHIRFVGTHAEYDKIKDIKNI